MLTSIKDKSVIVTGGSKGIGARHRTVFAAPGRQGHDRSPATKAALKKAACRN